MNRKELQQAERTFWGSLALSLRPEYWLSATFLRPYADDESISALRFAMRAIQKRIPSRRVIRGMASIERTWKNVHFEGCLHMHALLWGVDENIRDPDTFMHELVTSAFLRLRDSANRPMASPETIDIQRIYEPADVMRYMTKDMMKPDDQRSRIWLIKPNGFDTTTDYY